MEKKQIVLKNRGMNRDTSVSKVDGSSAYENHNIRIIAREEDTLLTVTNERGTKQVILPDVVPGNLIGWNVLNNHIILFVHIENAGIIDKIYRVDYENGEFTNNLLYTGHLNFDYKYPIESVVHFETEEIQKIYWIDGRNPLRFMNFMATEDEMETWDDTTFDSNRAASFDIDIKITKDNSGENRANGVVQYLLTYFNKHGQETGYVWMSDIVYLSPKESGGAADGTNNNRVVLTIEKGGLDTSFTHFRVYSIFRSTLNGQVTAYLVDEQKTTEDEAIVIDDGAHLILQDTTRLLYLGSQSVIAGTLEHKDETLFLGDLQSVGKANYNALEDEIKKYMFGVEEEGEIIQTPFEEGVTYLSYAVKFVYSNSGSPVGEVTTDDNKYIADIPYVEDAGTYPYTNQLNLTSSEILTFKGGEKYRFALKFQYKNGVETDAFWIGDVENKLYPVIDNEHHVIRRAVAMCTLPSAFVEYLKTETPFKTVRLCIAEATYADRSVKAQGIVNPTMFNVWERYQDRIYSVPSWTSRVRGADYPYQHFDSVERSNSSYSEIQCNWWEEDIDHSPYYQYKNYKAHDEEPANPTFLKDLGRENDWDKLMLVYRIRYKKGTNAGWGGLLDATVGGAGAVVWTAVGAAAKKVKYEVLVYAIKAKLFYQGCLTDLNNAVIAAYDDEETKENGKKQHKKDFDKFWTSQTDPDTGMQGYYSIIPYVDTSSGTPVTVDGARLTLVTSEFSASTVFNQGGAKNDAYKKLIHALVEMGLDRYAPTAEEFVDWCTAATHSGHDTQAPSTHTHRVYVNQNLWTGVESGIDIYDSMYAAVNAVGLQSVDLADRWKNPTDYDDSVVGDNGAYPAAFYKKHLMFVDENTVTMDSPELDYDAVTFDKKKIANGQFTDDNLKFRIVGFAKMSSVVSDYTIDATHSNVDGKSYDDENFSGRKNLAGLISWPLWREFNLNYNQEEEDEKYKEPKERSSSDYELGSRVIRYMLYMWHRNGSITGFTGRTDKNDKDEDEFDDLTITDNGYSILNHKTWANLRFSHTTIYMRDFLLYNPENIRISHEYGNTYLNMFMGNHNYSYNGNVQFSIGMPGGMKYPLFYSNIAKENVGEEVMADGAYLYSNLPIQLEFGSKTHAVISLGTNEARLEQDGSYTYTQQILPPCFEKETVDFSDLRDDEFKDTPDSATSYPVTGALVPWVDEKLTNNYLFFANNTIPQPTFYAEAWSDPPRHFYKATVANTGDGLDYVNAIRNAADYFSGEDVYITVIVTDFKMVLRIADLEIVEKPSNNIFELTFEDPKSIGYSDGTDAGPGQEEHTVMVKYVVPSAGDEDLVFMGSGVLHIWNNTIDTMAYGYRDYNVDQPDITLHPSNMDGVSDELVEGDKYLFIGEIYADCGTGEHDNRYGGIFEANVKNNRFISAGPAFSIDDMITEDPLTEDPVNTHIFGNQGDTYFQRWDSFRIKPYSNDAINQNIDIVSAMLETHINIDGRTDLQRGLPQLASIDQPQFNSINRVYSQKNNFIVRRDDDKDANTDSYRSSVTWTLPKKDMDDVDEWTHITLANTLKLDGDKGICRSLNRFTNRLLAFQDTAISEVLFNSMTQIGTQEGVPIEIANSGKVNGKHYFTNKYGCVNKWSIVEGKHALYFVDNINKAFCNVSVGQRGQLGAGDISTGKGFSMWFNRVNTTKPWDPIDFKNIVSYYDRVRSDIYLVKSDSVEESPCLVYNEMLGEFTSFFDYGSVQMMVNMEDRFLSYKRGRLWLQNEGFYCNFFGNQYDFWTQYRVTPDPYGDKIWTNLEYRADFYKMIDGETYTRVADIADLDGMEAIISATGYLYAIGPQSDKIHLAEATAGSLEDDTRVISDSSAVLRVRFVYDSDEDAYTIQNITEGSDNYGKYLSWYGRDLLSGKNLIEESRAYYWIIDIDDETGVATISPSGDDDYWIQFNRSAMRFCCYKSNQAQVAIYAKDENGPVQRDDLLESSFTDAKYGMYQPNETFDYIRFWNEYQTTEISEASRISTDKKFRIWRYQIPRAMREGTNIYGLDRIRNPWLNMLLKKKYSGPSDETNRDLMQMHDMTVIYYE